MPRAVNALIGRRSLGARIAPVQSSSRRRAQSGGSARNSGAKLVRSCRRPSRRASRVATRVTACGTGNCTGAIEDSPLLKRPRFGSAEPYPDCVGAACSSPAVKPRNGQTAYGRSARYPNDAHSPSRLLGGLGGPSAGNRVRHLRRDASAPVRAIYLGTAQALLSRSPPERQSKRRPAPGQCLGAPLRA